LVNARFTLADLTAADVQHQIAVVGNFDSVSTSKAKLNPQLLT